MFASIAHASTATTTFFAGGASYTGMLNDTGDSYAVSLNLTNTTNVSIQTWGFGGGVNGAGQTITPGGFVEAITLWQGTGSSATFLDLFAANQTDYSNYMGCGPAGERTFPLGDQQCGDDKVLNLPLAAGDYTIVVSDSNGLLGFPETTLGDGFGVPASEFYGCSPNNVTDANGNDNDCFESASNNGLNGNFAFDVTLQSNAPPVPEPGTVVLFFTGLGVCVRRLRQRA
jgi:hypothetical protein